MTQAISLQTKLIKTSMLSSIVAGIFALIGWFAHKRQEWAFLAGMILYGLDAGLLIYYERWLMVAFHGYLLFRISQGFSANRQLNTQA